MEEDKNWIAFAISMVLGCVTWVRRQYVLDKPLIPLLHHKVYSLIFSLFASALWWISIISVEKAWALQISAGFVATVMSWYALTLLVNEQVFPVRPKQIVSLLFYILNDTLLQVTTRLILR